MKASYKDIKRRIKEPVLWYDYNGTPRYDKFHPSLSPNIYADEVILLEISCQNCGRRFLVEMNCSKLSTDFFGERMEPFSERIKKWKESKKELKEKGMHIWPPVHYGDPPIHNCIGDTMNCYDLEIVEFWHRPEFDWHRKKEYEIELEKE